LISSTQALPAPSFRLSASRRRPVKGEKLINMELIYPKILKLAKTLTAEVLPGPNHIARDGIHDKNAE
jgi:hypothetical protein